MILSMILSLILNVVIILFTYFMLGNAKFVLFTMVICLLTTLWVLLRINQYLKMLENRLMMFTFIEIFVLNFDIQKTISSTLNVVLPLMPLKEQRILVKIRIEQNDNFLEFLRKHYVHQYYESFNQSVMAITERGGTLVKMTEVLLYSIDNSRSQLAKLQRIDNSYLIKFVINWLFIFGVGILFRFSLSNMVVFSDPPIEYSLGIFICVSIFVVTFVLLIENRIRRTKNVA